MKLTNYLKLALIATSAAALLACTSKSSSSTDSSSSGSAGSGSSANSNNPTPPAPGGPVITSSGFTVAAHPAMPTVQDLRGRVLNYPKFIPITFAGDTFANGIESFLSGFATSAEWMSMGTEYGISGASYGNPYRSNTSAPSSISDASIRSWLSAQINSNAKPFGIHSSQNIYTLYYPTTTTISAYGLTSCQNFAGYHDEYVDATLGQKVVYAVIARCSGDSINDTTATSSHELIEAATDPDSDTFGYYGFTSDYAIWQTLTQGNEVGDFCQMFLSSYYTPSAIGNQIQKSWSNASASNGNDPCVPLIPGRVYFNSAPVLPDTISYNDPTNGNQATTTRGVHIPLGTSKTIELDLYSSAQTSGNWTVSAIEAGNGTGLSFTFDKTSGKNGDKIYLTIRANSKNATYNAEAFWIKSSLNGVNNYWPVAVGN